MVAPKVNVSVVGSTKRMALEMRSACQWRPSVLEIVSMVDRMIPFRSGLCLKKHSQLVHMRIRYHFIANLHITLHLKKRVSRRK